MTKIMKYSTLRKNDDTSKGDGNGDGNSNGNDNGDYDNVIVKARQPFDHIDLSA